MFGFRKDAAPLLGLDLDDHSLRLAAIRPRFLSVANPEFGLRGSLIRLTSLFQGASSEISYELLAFATEPLPPGSLSEGRVPDVAGVAHAVRRAWERLGVETRGLCMALPDSLCMQRIIEVEAGLPDLELEALIELEAARAIPHPREDIALDHVPLVPEDSARDAAPERVPVLMVAARRDDLEGRLAVVREAGLQCSLLDVESLVFRRGQGWLTDVASGQISVASSTAASTALIDVGIDRLRLHVFAPDGRIYSREQHLDGQDGQPGAQLPSTESLVAEIQLALRFHASSQGNRPIDRLLLAGRVDRFLDLGERLSDQLGLEIQIADPSAGLRVQPSIKTCAFLNRPASGMLACALALRGFHG